MVVWHGLGDSAEAEGLQSFKTSLEEAFPGIYVHLIALGEAGADRKRGFFGDVIGPCSRVGSAAAGGGATGALPLATLAAGNWRHALERWSAALERRAGEGPPRPRPRPPRGTSLQSARRRPASSGGPR